MTNENSDIRRNWIKFTDKQIRDESSSVTPERIKEMADTITSLFKKFYIESKNLDENDLY